MTTNRLLGPAAMIVLFGVSLPGCAGLLCIACDGSLFVDGQVVGIQSTGSSDLGFGPQANASVPDAAVPLQGCSVALEPWSPGQQHSPKERARRTWHTETDQDGHFHVGGGSKAGTYSATLAVSCPGYRGLRSGFVHDSQQPHHAVAVMSR